VATGTGCFSRKFRPRTRNRTAVGEEEKQNEMQRKDEDSTGQGDDKLATTRVCDIQQQHTPKKSSLVVPARQLPPGGTCNTKSYREPRRGRKGHLETCSVHHLKRAATEYTTIVTKHSKRWAIKIRVRSSNSNSNSNERERIAPTLTRCDAKSRTARGYLLVPLAFYVILSYP